VKPPVLVLCLALGIGKYSYIISSKWGYSDPNCRFITQDTHNIEIKISREV
jgi:hypothetical protein